LEDDYEMNRRRFDPEAPSRVRPLLGRLSTFLVLAVVLMVSFGRSELTYADGPDGETSKEKLEEVAKNGPSDGGQFTIMSTDFYLDALATVPYGGSYSDVYLSSSWDTSCGFFACGNTIVYEYTRTIWYGSVPWNAYSMQLTNRWTQSGPSLTGVASCTIGYPSAASCTVSGSLSKTVTKTGPVWRDLWSVYNEFFAGVVDFDNFMPLGSLTETAISTICYWAGQCQQFQAQDSYP